jgi:hypothetical protein
MRRVALLAVALLVSGLSAPAHASDGGTWTVAGPSDEFSSGGSPVASIGYDRAAGTVTLAVSRGGRSVLLPSPVGIRTERADLSQGLTFLGRTTRRVSERYTTVVGKRTQRSATMTEARFAFRGTTGARVDLVVRVSRDGVAYRYALPADDGAVLGEASAFTVPAGATAWLAKYAVDNESMFNRTTAATAAAGEYEHPALFEVDGQYLMLAESDVDGRYSGGRLVHDAGSSTYRVKLWDDRVQVTGALNTPWRTMVVGDLNTIATSTLTDDLATPSRIADTSWIRPGKVFWSWLSGGREAGESLETQESYVDYAAAHGWPYILVDAGWYFDPNWNYRTGWEQTSWIPQLVKYAADRQVRVITWIHYDQLDTAEERAVRLPLFEKWGVAGLKIDFMNSESQQMFQWYDTIIPEAAAHHLMLDFHGSTIPHGTQRTWPNVVTFEGVYGEEHSAAATTADLTTLPFTRNAVGSMDYTPEAFQRVAPRRLTSDGHELGLSVVFESGIQNFAGSIDAYRARPAAQRFLDQVPTVWDETRLLAGSPGDSAVFARRSGDRWFLGGAYSGAARTAQVPLTLPAGRWLVDLVTDGPTGLVSQRRTVDAGTTMAVDIAQDGGFAAIACRWRPGLASCDRPVRVIPPTTVTVDPASATLTPGASVTVTGGFTVDASEAMTDVTMAPQVPAGWTVHGGPVTARRVRAGQTVSGTWTVTVAAEPTFGYVNVPVVARFHDPDRHRDFADQQTFRVHTWRPLPAGWNYLSDLPFAASSNGLGPVERDLTNGPAGAGDGKGIAIREVTYGKGLGTFAPSTVSFALGGRCTELVADVGVDDEAGLDVARASGAGGTVGFAVTGDGVTLATTGTMSTKDAARRLDVDLTRVSTVDLQVTDGGDGTLNDRASWGDARVLCS